VKTTNAEGRALDEIGQMFAERRKQFGRKPFGGYPHSFKNRTVGAVARGISLRDVAKAAGVSEPSIRTWCKQLKVKIEPPAELKLIEAKGCEASPQGKSGTAFIQFRSGLRIEIPVSGLSAELIKTLNGVAL
jgi:hypothetical protein